MKYIVTGTGRCGTLYMANLLASVGIPCGHESVFNRGVKDREWVADSSYMAAPFVKSVDATVIHVVRNPIDVIDSFVHGFCYFLSGTLEGFSDEDWVYEYPPGADPELKYQKFIYKHVPELSRKGMHAYERAAWYYVRWNEMIEQGAKVYYRHRIEDGVESLLAFLGKPDGPHVCRDRKINHVKNPGECSLDKIPNGEAKHLLTKMACRYGYALHIKI